MRPLVAQVAASKDNYRQAKRLIQDLLGLLDPLRAEVFWSNAADKNPQINLELVTGGCPQLIGRLFRHTIHFFIRKNEDSK